MNTSPILCFTNSPTLSCLWEYPLLDKSFQVDQKNNSSISEISLNGTATIITETIRDQKKKAKEEKQIATEMQLKKKMLKDALAKANGTTRMNIYGTSKLEKNHL